MSDHYFSDLPAVPDTRREVTVRAWGRQLAMQSAAGTFSAGRLDKATDLLLRSTEPPTAGQCVLDLGCGWGPIACALASAAPGATVWAVDINGRARELAARNAEALGLTVHVAAPEEVPADVRFDAIWSNPPIRIGKDALHELLERWLGRLTPQGVAHLVVSKNLGADSLHTWISEHGWPTDRVATANGFRVLRSVPMST
jgi:16S rRNA (guanine1207-N2)-methyltransferase